MNKSEANTPGYGDIEKRRESLKRYPKSYPPIDKLAEVGFFYSGGGGPEDDDCECFYCGVKLHHWSKDDDPIEEHRTFNKDCPFFQHKFGNMHNSFPVSNEIKPTNMYHTNYSSSNTSNMQIPSNQQGFNPHNRTVPSQSGTPIPSSLPAPRIPGLYTSLMQGSKVQTGEQHVNTDINSLLYRSLKHSNTPNPPIEKQPSVPPNRTESVQNYESAQTASTYSSQYTQLSQSARQLPPENTGVNKLPPSIHSGDRQFPKVPEEPIQSFVDQKPDYDLSQFNYKHNPANSNPQYQTGGYGYTDQNTAQLGLYSPPGSGRYFAGDINRRERQEPFQPMEPFYVPVSNRNPLQTENQDTQIRTATGLEHSFNPQPTPSQYRPPYRGATPLRAGLDGPYLHHDQFMHTRGQIRPSINSYNIPAVPVESNPRLQNLHYQMHPNQIRPNPDIPYYESPVRYNY